MTALKISAIAGSMIIAAGGSAAVATRDKWWPETTTSTNQATEDRISQPDSEVGGTTDQNAKAGKQCALNEGREESECVST